MKYTQKPIQGTSIIFAFFFILISFYPKTASSQKAKPSVNWTADWIWATDKGPNNSWLSLRKKVSLKSKPKKAITRIAAENKYWLYVNDSLVIRDGGLDGRPDLTNTYYDEIDLAPYLNKGDNCIAALVWYKGGVNSYSQITVDQGGFLFQSDLKGAGVSSIISDESWKMKINPAFIKTEQLRNPDGSYKWVAWPVLYDAQNEIGNWITYNYDDTSWVNAITKGRVPVAPWNNLVHRTIPFWKDYGLKPYLNNFKLKNTVITENSTVVGDLGINIQGTPYLKVDAPAGVRIKIVLNDFYHQEYITKKGVQEFECFAWQNSSSHTVKYEISNVTAPVKVLDLQFRETSYNAEIIGEFTSNDKDLNVLWEKCKNTSIVCMRDIYYDCPNRERGQWWGDVSEQILYSFCLYDTKSNLLSRKAYREFMYTQKPDGSLYTTAPGIEFHLPDQNITAVAMLWKYYMYSGDKALLEELYPQIKKFINYCNSTANEDGMLVLQSGVWNWIDWGDNKDVINGSVNTVVNASYILLLDAVMNIADLVGQNSDKLYYKTLQTKVKNNFNTYFWNDEANAYVFHKNGNKQSSTIDDRSNAWAVLAGMVDDSKREDVLKVLKTRYDSSPFQEMYVEMALLELDAEAMLVRMRNRHSEMINSWSSTLWEEFPAKNSNNHAWSAGPIFHLSTGVLGIRPSKVAYSEFNFLPKMGDLKQVSGTLPTPYGVIEASCNITNSTFTQTLISPPKTIGIVGIPKHIFSDTKIEEIKVGNIVIWKNGKPSKSVKGLDFYKEDDAYISFKVKYGSWVFTTIGK
ncbi:alpha-L-rhamnosidase C-terminal domain-containing protein [Mariniflexile litorale]|uniref:Alpha-L-rhamnosidase C-terminal domain-containing protein n=1 Tax=Mariniflexile litorale TaxID=3045158 RepID=A0AAU7EEI4_9FLAO|nr:alpha-L-rhamnosidase C-terminal domain-containing protein [Mariniflexile sp. KMM 9835]MDQ8211932.1 alpha-L-rhamnosidase C-terminal domain-containing protein [Mariniflexile sp. KMM 9835]